MQIALIGLSQSGKSTLFAAATGKAYDPVAAGAGQAERAVVKVPDERLNVLADMYKPKKITHATIDFLDVPGLSFVDEALRAEARKIVAQVRNTDMLVLVICGFANPSVAAYRDRVNPVADLEELRSELLLADLELIENRIEKLEKSVHKPSKTQDQDKKELALLLRCREAIENEQPLSSVIEGEEERVVRSFGFLTLKPMLIVENIAENKIGSAGVMGTEAAGTAVIALSAPIEAELAGLEDDDRAVFMEDLGVREIARDQLVQQCYTACKLVSFLTTGEDEVRAWTIPAECPAVEAAGAIHSDIQRGFIRAETVAYQDLIGAGDMKSAKAAGKIRLEGKTYAVQDGDIINFRFNV